MSVLFRRPMGALICVLAFNIIVNGQAVSRAARTTLTRIAGTRVSIEPPADFAPATQFTGYQLEDVSASILVTELPAPLKEASAGVVTPSELAKQNMRLLERRDVKVDGYSGFILHVEQTAYGTEFLKWILMLGNETECVMVTAAFPKDQARRLSQPMRASLLSTKWDVAKAVAVEEGLDFSVVEWGRLKLAKRLINTLLYTGDRIFPSKSPAVPFFMVGHLLPVLHLEGDDAKRFAETHVQSTKYVTDVRIEQTTPITIDGLNGYETLALGKDDDDAKQPIRMYQVMLFGDSNNYFMVGIIGGQYEAEHLASFKEMARSFKRKR